MSEAISTNVVVGKGMFIVSSAIVDITRCGITVEETADITLVIDEY